MDRLKIKYIWLQGFEGEQTYYEVGKNNVTEIKTANKNGEMVLITYWEVYKSGNLIADLHQVSEVGYFTKSEVKQSQKENHVRIY